MTERLPGKAVAVTSDKEWAELAAELWESYGQVHGLSKTAAMEPGPCGIRVNTVHPGLVETDMTTTSAPAFREANRRETPLGRTGTVDDITPLVVFLLSDDASFITGAEIPVDGGLTTRSGAKSISDALRADT